MKKELTSLFKTSTQGLVSVVVLTYNQEQFIRETLDSVLDQDYGNVQIIVSDDGSSDSTPLILEEYSKKYPSKIISVYSEVNTGIPANVNRALSHVRGEFLAWLGGDDVMLPKKISKQVDLLEVRKDAVACCHDAEVFVSETNFIIGLFGALKNKNKQYIEGGVELWFLPDYFILPSTVMYRTKYLPNHGFDERLKLKNDWLFDIEVFRHGICVPLNEVLVRYRRHNNNVTDSQVASQIAIEEGFMVLAIVESRYPKLSSLVKRRRKFLYLSAAVNSFKRQELDKSKEYLIAAIQNGSLIRGVALYIGLRICGPYIVNQLSKKLFERSKLFTKMTHLFFR